MTSEHIVDVSGADFEYQVITYSMNVPVLVDFWAGWCRPCKILGPILERLANEAQGAFRLARLDVDANPNIAMQYGVRSIPTVKAFSNGAVVSEFVGVLPEDRLRDFVSKIAPPTPTNLAIEKAEGYLQYHHWQPAETLFRELLERNPGNPVCLLGLAKSLLVQNKAAEAHAILVDFPDSRQQAHAELLHPLAGTLVRLSRNELPEKTELDAAFRNCLRLVGRDNLPAALDGLLDILRQDKHYANDLTRKVFVGILELMGETDPQTRQYRQELASVLH